MPFAILMLTIVIALGGFIDFLIGPPGHRRVNQRLIEFYVALEEGDWTTLYRRPAKALHQFMSHLLGVDQFSIQYILRTLAVSIGMTVLLFATIMIWTYVRDILVETKCPVPPILQFFQIVPFMGRYLIYILAINFVFDYFSWSLTQRALRHIINSQGVKPILISFLAPVAIAAVLYAIYSIYLPLALVVQMNDQGARFGFETVKSIFLMNVRSNYFLLQIPHRPYYLDCSSPGHTFFSISYVSTMQILAAETVIPIFLLFATSIFGVLAYLTKPFTRRPLSLLTERIDSSGMRVTLILLGFASGILALLIAFAKYQEGSGLVSFPLA